jgi:elongation factor 2
MNKLWGDNFYDPESKKFVTDPTDSNGKPLQRTFVKFVIDPIIKMSKAIIENDVLTYE